MVRSDVMEADAGLEAHCTMVWAIPSSRVLHRCVAGNAVVRAGCLAPSRYGAYDWLDGFHTFRQATSPMTIPPRTSLATPAAPADLFLALGVGEHAKRSGEPAPDVTVVDSTGRLVRLRDRWTVGPLVVVFFRGGWCNYCNLQLREWQRHHQALCRAGAQLLAISPQVPERSAATNAGTALAFPVLSDADLTAANAFGIAFTLPAELVEYFTEIGTDIPVLNGNGLWALPVPATYVIDTRGLIRYAEVEPDYRRRPDPGAALQALEAATTESRARR